MALWPLHSSAQFARDRTGFADAHQQNFLPFWAFPVANKLTSVPFFPNLKILKRYGYHNLEHDLQISSRHSSGKTASPEFCLGCRTQHKHRNVVVVVNDDDNNNSKQMLAHGLGSCSGSI